MDTALSLGVATLVVTFSTGVALAVFAWLTHRLSKSITQRRYSPILEVYPIGSPETGSFEQNGLRFHGVKWRLSLINSGDVPIWADSINISIQVTRLYEPERNVWAGIGKLCELYDDKGNLLADRAVGINGNSHCIITVFLCHEDAIPEQHKLFKTGDTTQMQFELLQRGIPTRPIGWLMQRSDRFRVPERFGKEPNPHLG
jgi:hypothetical protein